MNAAVLARAKRPHPARGLGDQGDDDVLRIREVRPGAARFAAISSPNAADISCENADATHVGQQRGVEGVRNLLLGQADFASQRHSDQTRTHRVPRRQPVSQVSDEGQAPEQVGKAELGSHRSIVTLPPPRDKGFLTTRLVQSLVSLVELRGFEPLTFSLRTRRATNCATAPNSRRTTRRERYHRARSVPNPVRSRWRDALPRRSRARRRHRRRPRGRWRWSPRCGRRSRRRARRGRSCGRYAGLPPAW